VVLVENDPTTEIKAKARETWALGDFDQIAQLFTSPVAGNFVRFAGVKAGEKVLDVGTGTGVVAITAARAGGKVTGMDLTPELLLRAKQHADIAGTPSIKWDEGDAEKLPYRDSEFDVVLSQFGHMFAPRPEVATKEMLRVLRPGGRIAFATWPPEQLIGRSFTLNGAYVPPPPGQAPPPQWGDVTIVKQRLGTAVKDIHFERGTGPWPALSVSHYRTFQEQYGGPFIRTVNALKNEPVKLEKWRREYDAMTQDYFADNVVRLEYLMTRATKA
jgi:SAM-dependent methyltransferase